MSVALLPRWDPARQVRPVEQWPEADRRAWAAALAPGDVLEPSGAGSHWAPLTKLEVSKGYGRWLTWLDGIGQRDNALPPAGQVTPERVRDFIAALQVVNAPITVLNRVRFLACAAAALAPGSDWAWLRAIAARLQRRARPVRLKHLRVVGADDLFQLGSELMGQAEQGRGRPAWRRAIEYRDGLMIALLAARPLRMKNFASIEIGRHLVAHGEHYRLAFPREETKTRRAIELPFPEQLIPALQRYLSHHRPVLCDRYQSDITHQLPPGQALWVNQRGCALDRSGLSMRIVKLTEQRFGRRINPHLFRDCAATSIALDHPEDVGITSSLLGHARITTSEGSYNHAPSLQATRHYQNEILAIRANPARAARERQRCPARAAIQSG